MKKTVFLLALLFCFLLGETAAFAADTTVAVVPAESTVSPGSTSTVKSALSESALPKEFDIQQLNKEIQKLSEKFKKLKNFKIKGIVPLEEIKEETLVVEPQEFEKDPLGKACGSLLGRLDPNERSQEICEIFWKADGIMKEGKWDEAKTLLEKSIVRFPESRHLHKLLAETYWYLYDGKDPSLLEQAIKEAGTGLNIGMSFGQVDYHLTALLSQLLGEAKDVKTLDRIFEKVFSLDDSPIFHEDYVKALIKMGDPWAEEALKKEVKNGRMIDIYAEWLLNHGREKEVLILPLNDNLYMRFYRAVALEKLNRLKEAKFEYEKYKEYYWHPEYGDTSLPLPKRFQILGSKLQKELEIHFEGEETGEKIQATTAISDTQAIKGFSYLIWGEARGETIGGMRAVGWIVRSRVLRGSVGSPACPYVVNTGSTFADKYKSVMCQSSQFDGMCRYWCDDPNTTKCTDNGTTYNAANDVYNGKAPDPVGQHCPGGITNWGESYCADSTQCYGYKNTYRLAGPVFNYGTSGSCPSHSCAPNSAGKICSNDKLDNCFYSNPKYCVGSGCVTYSGSLSGPGQCVASASFYSSITGYHKGHLEGPEGNHNLVDFDLYLQRWINNEWQTVASSIRYGSVDDINYHGTSGSYRWVVCSYSGSGSLMLYTSRPQ